MTEQPSTPDKIIVTGHFSGYTSAELFEYWTKPELVIQWWAQQAEIDPRVGGSYHFTWPQPELDWHLRGVYTRFEPSESLGFTWNWDHEPHTVERQVLVAFCDTEDGGSDMTVEHWPFGEDEAADRQGIVEGWIHFGMRLAGLRESSG
jgi:uncharacterized protein YndB with AHSA1/START domain